MSTQTLTVRQFMTASPETIAADLTLAQARERMYGLGVRHLPVLEGSELVGVLSERDITLVESLEGDLAKIPVRRAMTACPFTCGPEAHVHAVAAEMAAHKYGSAIVVDRDHPGHVVGVFTTIDALRALAQVSGHG